ncbi:MAG: hypothetical protein QOD97_1706 [Mycobacterium sp.]|nr:hypothetical protein [Mycobacterium sp.]
MCGIRPSTAAASWASNSSNGARRSRSVTMSRYVSATAPVSMTDSPAAVPIPGNSANTAAWAS